MFPRNEYANLRNELETLRNDRAPSDLEVDLISAARLYGWARLGQALRERRDRFCRPQADRRQVVALQLAASAEELPAQLLPRFRLDFPEGLLAWEEEEEEEE